MVEIMTIVIIVLIVALSSCSTTARVNDSFPVEVFRAKRQTGKCILPPQPEGGVYTVGGVAGASPGQELSAALLEITCRSGFSPRGSDVLLCVNGVWSVELQPPLCVRACRLEPHASVIYRCLEEGGKAGDRPCRDFEPTGTIVKPQCNAPNYSNQRTFSRMRCIEGRWNYVAMCDPDCGKITPEGVPQIINGEQAKHGEFPWHAGIYLKTFEPYRLVCGGSIISTTVVVTAAHCIWSRGQVRPASDVAVTVGKLYRGWNNPLDDSEAQKIDVISMKVPVHYQHSRTNFQNDIATLTLAAAIIFQPYIKPVCLDFDPIFDRAQLKEGNIGKVAGWGLTQPDGSPATILQVLKLPYVSVQRCIDESPEAFKSFITSDKICAGYTNGSATCRGDSGGGLVFSEESRGVEKYYLRGVVSTAPESDAACNAFARTSFTHFIKHQEFIEENMILFEQSSFIYEQGMTAVCVLPLYPQRGRYELAGTGGASPGQAFYLAQLDVVCNDAHYPDQNPSLSCKHGVWNASLPNCVACGQGSISGGSEQPWVAMVYIKMNRTLRCGAVVIRPSVILASSICIINPRHHTVQNPATFLVAAGKLHPKLDDPRDSQYAQTSDVISIHVSGFTYPVSERERHVSFSFYHEIAALSLATAFTFNSRVQPICIDLDEGFAKRQLAESNGKTISIERNNNTIESESKEDQILAAIKEDGDLKNVEVSNVNKTTCHNGYPYRDYDEIWALDCHKPTGTKGMCPFDMGFPIVYPKTTTAGKRYYLRAFNFNKIVGGNPQCDPGRPFLATPLNRYLKDNLNALGIFIQ